ncbi:hypothetical protein [Streptomyces sp. DH10]|uniref:hypothetical protein n=1 Tax=Streptomyces sp. DH10 TaxID=3040121 RepID=UPI002442F7B6|nr:hypothetical protein [Streptomyces sp. DH10]MDG9709497.1 hypothetical protein [Streptomyces sp. DH10]
MRRGRGSAAAHSETGPAPASNLQGTETPAGYRTGLVRRRAQDLYEAIPAQHHHERAVRELRDVLAA